MRGGAEPRPARVSLLKWHGESLEGHWREGPDVSGTSLGVYTTALAECKTPQGFSVTLRLFLKSNTGLMEKTSEQN